MAMTVRLPAELDARLEAVARARHVSKHAALLEAVTRYTDTESKTARVLEAIDEIGEQYADTIKRLEDA